MNVKKFISPSGDHLFIENFSISCRVGTTAEERVHPQKIMLCLKVFLDLKRAGKTDRMESTLNYAEIIDQIRTVTSKGEYQLVERVAESIAQKILENKKVSAVEIKVGKKVFQDMDSIGAQIVRSR